MTSESDSGLSLNQSCVNLIFGYSQGRPSPSSSPLDIPLASEIPPASSVPAGTDLLTSLIGRLAVVLDIDLDIATWSRLIGLVLVGSIILANMRHVLGSISRVSTCRFLLEVLEDDTNLSSRRRCSRQLPLGSARRSCYFCLQNLW